MSYEAYLEEFRRQTAQRVAEFERAVKAAEASVQQTKKHQVKHNKNAPRRRGRVRGVLRTASQY
ncbi:hypothetical protein [Corynebacterium gerontici]|uniref:Uncharacterized protein n=1 Tax=Corynebacterium gerontici TaxID=2079234 RepID=A0A3G6J6H0_9CORY|nr:hypothetical protein [Corynebacterium gerontici]AZA12040.1 hypothetical protein CGERO_08745 [Corynebacterium gerontici]